MIYSTNKIKDYSEEELREWIKKAYPNYKQRVDDENTFEYIVKEQNKKQVHTLRIGKYYGRNKKFISVSSQRMYGDYGGCGLPSDTFEDVIENQKYAYNYIQEKEKQQEYETIPLF